MKKVINKAIVRYFRHFDNEIDFADSEGSEDMKVTTSSLRSVFKPTRTTSTSCQELDEKVAKIAPSCASWFCLSGFFRIFRECRDHPAQKIHAERSSNLLSLVKLG